MPHFFCHASGRAAYSNGTLRVGRNFIDALAWPQVGSLTNDRVVLEPRRPRSPVKPARPIDPPPLVRAQIQDEMTRYAAGHRDAFEPVFEMLWPLVRSFTARALGSADAEDAAQDALLKVFARIADFDPTRDALGWALGIAYYEVRTLRRRVQRRREDDPAVIERVEHHDPIADEVMISAQLRAALAAALEQLSEDDREVLDVVLRDVDQQSGPADAAARKRRQRARDRLRAIWRKVYGHH